MDRHRDGDFADDVHAAVALFAALVAGGIAVLGYLCRLGFADNPPLEWGKFVGLSWFLLFFSLVVRKLLSLGGSRTLASAWTGHGLLTLAALAVAALFGVEWPSAAGNTAGSAAMTSALAMFIFALGGAGFLLALFALLRRARLRDMAALVGFAVVFSVYGAGASYGNGFQNPLFVEGLCFKTGYIDQLFHASISNMLRTYGVASTGLDGVPFLPYHFGSHWLFAQFCNLLDVRVIDFYTRGYRVIFVPLSVLSLGTLAAAIVWQKGRTLPQLGLMADKDRSTGNDMEPRLSLLPRQRRLWPTGGLFWLVVCAGYISFMPYNPAYSPLYALSMIVISESYNLAVSVSLLGLAWAWCFFQELRDSPNRSSANVIAGALFVAVLMAVLNLLKISQVAVLLVAAAYFFIRLAWYRSPVHIVLVASAVVGACAVLPLTLNPGYGGVTNASGPFQFVRAFVEPQLWAYFWVFYFAWLWIAAAVRLRQEGARTFGELAAALRARRLLDVELLFVAAVAGAIPAMLFFSSTAAQFFAEYQQWLALAVLLSIVTAQRVHSDTRVPAVSADSSSNQRNRPRLCAWREVTIGRVFLSAVLLTVAGEVISNTGTIASWMVHTDAMCRGHAGGRLGIFASLRRGQFGEARRLLDQTAADVERRFQSDKNVLSILSSLDRMPLSQKRSSILFIPKSNRQFWDLLHGSFWPLEGPLVAPALSGIAMIDGLPDPPPVNCVWYGYDRYRQRDPASRQPSLAEYLPVLLRRCGGMGFKQLIVIDSSADGRCTEHRYACP